jgi:hypothetical protein
LLLSVADGFVEARGFRSFFAVGTDKNEPFKYCFEPDTPRTEKAVPRCLLFTRLNESENSNLQKLTQAETMTRLLRACPWATYDTSIAGANLGCFLPSRASNRFDLSAGRDLLEPRPCWLWLKDVLFSPNLLVSFLWLTFLWLNMDYGPRRLTLELGNICNLHCSYCLRSDENLYSSHAEFLPLELLRRVIADARDVAGVTRINFTAVSQHSIRSLPKHSAP